MNIQANPNPTNSEMDSKTILKPELTDSQRDELTAQYVELVVDQMDVKTLVQIVTDNLIDYHNEAVSYTHLTLPTIYSV